MPTKITIEGKLKFLKLTKGLTKNQPFGGYSIFLKIIKWHRKERDSDGN